MDGRRVDPPRVASPAEAAWTSVPSVTADAKRGPNAADIERAIASVEATLDLLDPSVREWGREYFSKHRARYASDLSMIRALHRGGTILEVGSMPCHLTACLQLMGYPVEGLDVDPARAEWFISHHRLNVRACNVETERIPAEDGAFTLVLFNEIFEHLRIDPIFTLEEVARVTAPGGRLMLTTPNLYSATNLLRMRRRMGVNDIYDEYAKLRTIGHMGHVREYAPKEVVEFLTHFGFETRRVAYRSYRKRRGRGVKARVLNAGLDAASRGVPSLRAYQIVIAERVDERSANVT
jgi:SAM-dependent methyltransferase